MRIVIALAWLLVSCLSALLVWVAIGDFPRLPDDRVAVLRMLLPLYAALTLHGLQKFVEFTNPEGE